MSVNIIWSLSNGGDALSGILDHGSTPNGSNATELEIFVRHDHSAEITAAGLYVASFSGAYSGGATAVADLAELISWGDGADADAFGGLQVNLLATTAYPAAGWPTWSSKSPAGGFVHRTGVGDSVGNAVELPTSTGVSVAGEIPAGSSPNVRFKMRAEVPADEDTVGIRQWDHMLTFSYTS